MGNCARDPNMAVIGSDQLTDAALDALLAAELHMMRYCPAHAPAVERTCRALAAAMEYSWPRAERRAGRVAEASRAIEACARLPSLHPVEMLYAVRGARLETRVLQTRAICAGLGDLLQVRPRAPADLIADAVFGTEAAVDDLVAQHPDYATSRSTLLRMPWLLASIIRRPVANRVHVESIGRKLSMAWDYFVVVADLVCGSPGCTASIQLEFGHPITCAPLYAMSYSDVGIVFDGPRARGPFRASYTRYWLPSADLEELLWGEGVLYIDGCAGVMRAGGLF